MQIKPPCNRTCECDESVFAPICTSTGETYFSACHAGCANLTHVENQIGNTTVSIDRSLSDEFLLIFQIKTCFSWFFTNSVFELWVSGCGCDGDVWLLPTRVQQSLLVHRDFFVFRFDPFDQRGGLHVAHPPLRSRQGQSHGVGAHSIRHRIVWYCHIFSTIHFSNNTLQRWIERPFDQ